MSNIEGRLRETDRGQGRESEQLVCAALEVMVEKREISQFERIEPRSELDYEGINFFVVIKGQQFPLQVKSSRRGLKRAREKHPGVSVIRARPGDPIEKIRWRLKSELGKAEKRHLREANLIK